MVKGHLLQTCSFQLWEALDGNRLQPHALPQHSGPRMVTLRKRQAEKRKKAEVKHWKDYLQSQAAFFLSEFGCDPAQTHLFVILKGSWFMCFWSELEFCNKANLPDLPCRNWYSAVEVLCTPLTNHPLNIVQQKFGLKSVKITPNSLQEPFLDIHRFRYFSLIGTCLDKYALKGSVWDT